MPRHVRGAVHVVACNSAQPRGPGMRVNREARRTERMANERGKRRGGRTRANLAAATARRSVRVKLTPANVGA